MLVCTASNAAAQTRSLISNLSAIIKPNHTRYVDILLILTSVSLALLPVICINSWQQSKSEIGIILTPN